MEPNSLCRQDLVLPHLQSFNFFVDEGLQNAVKELIPEELQFPTKDRLALTLTNPHIGVPTRAGDSVLEALKVYPSECRQCGTTYKAKLTATVNIFLNDRLNQSSRQLVGEIPIMVKSRRCHLTHMNASDHIRHGEEASEMGGYFIVHGLEKLVRLLLVTRRNYVITLHYLSNGSAVVCFIHQKEQFFVPLIMILKGLCSVTDNCIYNELIHGMDDGDDFYKGCVLNMIRSCGEDGFQTQIHVLQYIGNKFRIAVQLPSWYSDAQIGRFLLDYMCKKLFALAKGKCKAESADNPMFQEVLLPGHLYLMILKERLQLWLQRIRRRLEIDVAQKSFADLFGAKTMISAIGSSSTELSRSFEYFLATGNLNTKAGLGMQQVSGLTIIAEKLNFYRYVSHFRSVHRGAYFAQMRTTTVRKLLPEAWGFICPVHTPDGSPCGLLNHLALSCKVVASSPNDDALLSTSQLLQSLGMESTEYALLRNPLSCDYYCVLMDGAVLGYLPCELASDVTRKLRELKLSRDQRINSLMEICLVPNTGLCAYYPGLYLFTDGGRLVRPVRNIAHDQIEYVGTFEQVYLGICVTSKEDADHVSHQELTQTSMLSFIANLTPFSDFNQSPRNMYQCQMGKQTMGTPCHSIVHRADNKLYRVQTPQSPLVRPELYATYRLDDYPLGTNAVVAVVSYTGYDMEDAMIINKSSFERGFAHGSIYKCERVNLKKVDGSGRSKIVRYVFHRDPKNLKLKQYLDSDGLPFVGQELTYNDPYYCYANCETGQYVVKKFTHSESATVDHVKVLGSDDNTAGLYHVCIMLRIKRNPTIGDKFASRHGQKGVCSQLWPAEDMPFTESGIMPDIIFNPHGFPSRMTIGMMIESMAGKSASLHGLRHDASPFRFSEKLSAIDYFGNLLRTGGFNYFGCERMYSGVDGREFDVDVFFGVVYYQRLRHMVADKYQVRTTGPVDQLTRQPVHGRKRGGGVRFGEMERDSLLAHGSAFLIQDRLFNCSDKDYAFVCGKCGSILSTLFNRSLPCGELDANARCDIVLDLRKRWSCQMCKNSDNVRPLSIPYVLRYLVAELASMNIKTIVDFK